VQNARFFFLKGAFAHFLPMPTWDWEDSRRLLGLYYLCAFCCENIISSNLN